MSHNRDRHREPPRDRHDSYRDQRRPHSPPRPPPPASRRQHSGEWGSHAARPSDRPRAADGDHGGGSSWQPPLLAGAGRAGDAEPRERSRQSSGDRAPRPRGQWPARRSTSPLPPPPPAAAAMGASLPPPPAARHAAPGTHSQRGPHASSTAASSQESASQGWTAPLSRSLRNGWVPPDLLSKLKAAEAEAETPEGYAALQSRTAALETGLHRTRAGLERTEREMHRHQALMDLFGAEYLTIV